MVGDEFEDLFPGQVLSVETVHETAALESLVATYTSTNLKLWDLIGDYSSKKLKGKKIKRSEVRELAHQGCAPSSLVSAHFTDRYGGL